MHNRKRQDDAVFMLGFVMLACSAGAVFGLIAWLIFR
jgi:hypothetical protein